MRKQHLWIVGFLIAGTFVAEEVGKDNDARNEFVWTESSYKDSCDQFVYILGKRQGVSSGPQARNPCRRTSL
jgi:hypothetical protein